MTWSKKSIYSDILSCPAGSPSLFLPADDSLLISIQFMDCFAMSILLKRFLSIDLLIWELSNSGLLIFGYLIEKYPEFSKCSSIDLYLNIFIYIFIVNFFLSVKSPHIFPLLLMNYYMYWVFICCIFSVFLLVTWIQKKNILIFRDRFSLCNCSWPGTHYMAQAGLELTMNTRLAFIWSICLASPSEVLRFHSEPSHLIYK